MNCKNNDYKGSELHLRFTVWIRTVIQNAKIDYIRRRTRQVATISINNTPDEKLAYEDRYDIDGFDLTIGRFDFEDELMAKAFAGLSLKRRKILLLLFVEEYKPSEIAKLLHCKPKTIYNERVLALEYLRKMLLNGGNRDE